jgi:hypothetical protein
MQEKQDSSTVEYSCVCIHGECENDECTCEDGWTGKKCDISSVATSEDESQWWKPSISDTFQIILQGPNDLSIETSIYDVDLFSTTAEEVQKIRDLGRKSLAYISVGSIEDWRPDYDLFPKSVFAEKYDGWPGETWLDISQLETEPKIKEILEARIELAKSKGFQGIEPDNMDAAYNGISSASGEEITPADQLAFNKWVAETAHKHGLAVGLKNDLNQLSELVPYFDFGVVESCYKYNECGLLRAFTDAGKPVFAIEYSSDSAICTQAAELKLTVVFKTIDLNAQPYSTCSLS